MDKGHEVSSYIIDRVKNITNDSRTFLLVRSMHIAYLNDDDLQIGGGNLLIAMGNFSVFEYLSRIYYALTNTPSKWFDQEKNWDFKPPADVCFEHLILNNRSGVPFGIEKLEDKDLKLFWKEWRNKLSHLLCQNERHTSISLLTPKKLNQRSWYLDFINSSVNDKVAFSKVDNSWQCYIDILNRDLDKLSSWIAKDVLSKANEENINRLHDWLTSNLRN